MDLKIRGFYRFQCAGLLLFGWIFITACSPAADLATAASPSTRPTRAGQLTPYIVHPTSAAGAGPAGSASLPTATPMPSPTPTPRTHEVKKGEDMGGIAWKYRVPLEELMAANPTVRPNMMSVGTKLIIPPSKTQLPPGDNPVGSDAAPPTPTAVPLSAGSLSCARVEDGGVWCFLPVRSSQAFPLEGVSAVFRLAGRQSQDVFSQLAFLPLDRLEPGASLPLAAYFPPEQIAALAPPYQAYSELLTALPGAEDGRYLPIHLENKKVLLAENGRSANLSADIFLDSSGDASRVWVAAVAYDAQGNVVGVRRWESQADQPLKRGQAVNMTMSVYSVSAAIERVEMFVEARP